LDVPHGPLVVLSGEVEVVEAERLLEDGVVLLLGQRHDRVAVVERVIAPYLIGAVGQAVRVGVTGRVEQELGAVGRPGGHGDDVALVDLAAAVRGNHYYPGDRAPGAVG